MILGEFDFSFLADVNASLNATAFLIIILGLIAIKRGNEAAHKSLMLTAAAVSALFLISYVTYHLTCKAVRFEREGAIRTFYFFVLITHIVLAATVAPLVLTTIYFGLKDKRKAHRRLAKITTPVWIYVSITGVIVYVMLYRM